MSAPHIATLLDTALVRVSDVRLAKMAGNGALELGSGPCLVFPYKGIFVIDMDGEQVVADTSQVIFADGQPSYSIDRPHATASACLVIRIEDDFLRDIVPKTLLAEGSPIVFLERRLRIDARAQALVAMVRHGLTQGSASVLEGETLASTLVRRSVAPRTTHAAGSTKGRRKLVDRAKLVLLADPGRAWTLADIATRVGVSPVYLTQSFAAVEGIPLYKYQTRLRLARALDLLNDYDDLAMLAQDLGFSSHSHFTAAFRQMYGRTPTEFRQAVLKR